MKKLIIFALLVMPFVAQAQRLEIYEDERGNDYLGLYAYGLQRDIVKTNDEMRASVNEAGITRRHHTTKGNEDRIGSEGYNANPEVSFAFLIAPYNVDVNGQHTSNVNETMTWTKASGWDSSIDDVNCNFEVGDSGPGAGDSPIAARPTGCAAYQGADGLDAQGEWRLPTQREIQIMFTIMEQATAFVESGEVETEILSGKYWTSTEFCVSGGATVWNAWYLNNFNGFTEYTPRGSSVSYFARCVKDLYLPINE